MSCNKVYTEPYYCGEFYEDESGAWGTWQCAECSSKAADKALGEAYAELRNVKQAFETYKISFKNQTKHLLVTQLAVQGAITALEARDAVSALGILKASIPK